MIMRWFFISMLGRHNQVAHVVGLLSQAVSPSMRGSIFSFSQSKFCSRNSMQ